MTEILDYRFPNDIALGAMGGPEFHTDIIETPEGREQRQIRRLQPRARYRLCYGLKNFAQLDQLRALYYLTKGRAYGFKYQDPLDHKVQDQEIGKGDGTKLEFQLIKTYAFDQKNAFTRFITCPRAETLRISVGGGVVQNYTLLPKGKLRFDAPPDEGTVITANFIFDVPVRFDTDFLAQKIEGPNAALVDDIQLIEIL